MNNIVLSTRNIDDLIEDIANEVVKKIDLWNVKTKPPQQQHTEFLTRQETANLLKISLPTLLEYTKTGVLKGYRISGRVLYKREEVEEALTEIKTIKYRKY